MIMIIINHVLVKFNMEKGPKAVLTCVQAYESFCKT